MNHHTITTWIRIVLASLLAAATGLVVSSAGSQAALDYDANGADPGGAIGDLSRFQIDGDAVVQAAPGSGSNGSFGANVTGDWAGSPYGPQPIGTDGTAIPPAGIGSSGLLPLLFADIRSEDVPAIDQVANPQFGYVPGAPTNCPVSIDDSWVGGTKVDSVVDIDVPVIGPGGAIQLQCSNADPGKGDLLRAYAAYEVVAVPNEFGNPAAGSRNRTIIYGAWERGELPGELNFYVPISDGVPGNTGGDRLIAFDYDSNGKTPAERVKFRVLSWNGTGWVVASGGNGGTDPAVFEASVGYVGGGTFPDNGKPSFGEFALDLTATGILPDGSSGQCVELSTAGYIFTETGNSGNAQLTDYVGAPKVPIGNCGDLEVTKAGPAAADPTVSFPFRVEQQDSAVIRPGGATTLDDTFVIGETKRFTGVYAQPDYVAFEDPYAISSPGPDALPDGWQMTTVECTYVDLFNTDRDADWYEVVTETLWSKDASPQRDLSKYLQVIPAAILDQLIAAGEVAADFVPGCVITNDASGIIVGKVTLPGDSTTEFPFAVTTQSGGTTVELDTFPLGNDDTQFVAADEGAVVTITEGDVDDSPSWQLQDVVCTNEDGSPATITSETERSVTLTVGSIDNTISCVFVNRQNGRIVIEKTGTGADADTTGFTFDISGTPAGPISIGGSTDPLEVTPGQYTVTEDQPVSGPSGYEFVLTDVRCTDEVSDVATGKVVSVSPGGTTTCTFNNDQRGPVTVAKDAVSVTPGAVLGEYVVEYSVTVTSDSNVAEDITVDDAFDFPATITLVGAASASPDTVDPDWDGVTNTTLFDGQIAANAELSWTLTATVHVALDAPAADRDCDAGGSGAWNDVTLTHDGTNVTDDACIPFDNPDIDVQKSVVGPVTVNGDGSMAVSYRIDVTNLDPNPDDDVAVGPGEYTLSDTFGFPSWVTVTSATVDSGTVPGYNPTLGPTGGVIHALPVGIGGGETHTYVVTVNLTAAPTATAAGADCGRGPGEGLFNLASITSTNGPDSDDACTDIPRGQLRVTKGTFGDTGTFSFTSSVPGALIDGRSITTTADDGSASGNTLDAWVTPGSYTVTEADQTGWTKIAQPCGDATPALVTDGATTTCAFTNGKQSEIVVEKYADPDGTFPFTLGGDATGSADLATVAGFATVTWDGLDAGTYTVTETTPAGFFIDNAVCGQRAHVNGSALTLGWGESLTCTYTNEAFAEIVIEKEIDSVDPDAGTVEFAFTGDLGDFSLVGGGSEPSGAVLLAGTYTITETVTTGWDLTDLECRTESLVGQPTSSDSTPDLDAASVSVELAAGDQVTCTFTNTQRGAITVIKDVPADSAILTARDQAFDFSIDTLVPDVVATFSLDDSETTADPTDRETTEVLPGTYAVTETEVDGWTLDSVSCDGVAIDPIDGSITTFVEPGETVECTFTNVPDPADVTIAKTVTDVADDYPWSFEFEISSLDAPIAPVPASRSAAGVGPDTVTIGWQGLIPGATYTITEIPVDDWQPAVLDCGDADIDGVVDDSVTFVATVGMALSCSITNTPVAPTLIIEKRTIGDVGTFDFSIAPATVDDTTAVSIETTTPDTFTPSATYDLLTGESYRVDEIDVPAEWAEGTLVCEGATSGTPATGTGAAAFSVDAGDDVVCRVTNSALGNITIIKSVIGADGIFTFTMDPAIEPITDADGDFTIDTAGTDPDQVEFLNLQPGTYVVSEIDPTATFDNTDLVCSGPDGSYEVSDLEATITLANGDSVFCTFTNTERGYVKVNKITDPAGDTDDFPFSMTGQPDFVLADGESFTSSPVPSGVDYTVSEDLTDADDVDPNWVLTSIACSDDQEIDTASSATGGSVTVQPGPGEVVECTFTNELRGPITVVKDDPTEVVYDATTGTYSATYAVTVTSTSQIDEVFDMVELPGFPASGVDLQRLVVTGPGLAGVDALTAGTPLLDDQPIPELGELVYTVVATFTIDGAADARECTGEPGNGAYNAVRVTNDISDATDAGCIDLPLPTISVTKDAVSVPAQPVYQGGNAYTVAYDIVVTNTGDGPGSYTLTEDPDFGTGIAITGISASSADGTVAPGFSLGDLTLADAVELTAGESHTYRVTVAFTIAGSATLTARDCDGPGTATYNQVDLTYNGRTGEPADDCVELPDPEITVTKAVSDGQPVHVGQNVYTAEYTVTVDNVGDGPGAYDLVDTPDFGTGATVTNVAVTGHGVSIDQDGDAPVTIVTGESIDPDEAAHVYTVTVTFEVAGSMTTAARTCVEGEDRAGFGAYNGAQVSYQGGSDSDDDCVDIPEPDVSIVKSLDVANPLTRNADGTWAIGYLLTVSNATGAGPADYDLTDTFDFPSGVSVDDVQVQIVGADPASSVLVAGFDGAGQRAIAAGVRIDDGETHVYRVLVDLTIQVVPGIDGDCAGDGGLVNTMSVAVRGGEPLTDDACDSFSTLTLVKRVVNDGGGTAGPSAFTLTATGPATISGAGTVASAVPAGTYRLSETSVAGYSRTSLTCDNAGGQVTTATVADGANVTCTFVNDDDAVADLAIVKTASVATTGPNGAFDWTLEVTNNGPATAVDVVVADIVPSTLTVGDVTSSFFECARSGNVITCTRPSMAVGASGTITIAVTVNASAIDGPIVNVGTVESSTPDPDLTNNSDDASVDVVVPLPPVAPPPPVTLPRTGSDSTGPLVRSALLLILLGGAVVLVTRRRRQDGTTTPGA